MKQCEEKIVTQLLFCVIYCQKLTKTILLSKEAKLKHLCVCQIPFAHLSITVPWRYCDASSVIRDVQRLRLQHLGAKIDVNKVPVELTSMTHWL
jgi:hypothetical protein